MKPFIKNLVKSIAISMAFSVAILWLPVLMFYAARNPKQIIDILAIFSCIAAFALYGYGVLLLILMGIKKVYVNYFQVLRIISRNREIFNQFKRWARANDKTII